MDHTQLKRVHDFEDSLTVGMKVLVCWTHSGRSFRARGEVSKVNAKSVRVKLTEEVGTDFYGGYPVGREIKAPLLSFTTMHLWSCNNRVEPEGGY